MRPANVELTMGHDIGISKSYYKPTENEILNDYLQAMELLSVNPGINKKLEKEVKELSIRNENNESLIKAKLQEKDEQIQQLIKRDRMKDDVIADMSDQLVMITKKINQLENRH